MADTSELLPDALPRHVAIIMDGNGRWARKRLLNRVNGHEKGADAVLSVVRTCRHLGIPFLTLYAFSTENWQRPEGEINALMRLLKRFLREQEPEMIKNDIRLQVIGQVYRLPDDVQQMLQRIMQRTGDNTGLTLNLALSYGGRSEITDMVRSIGANLQKGLLTLDDIDEQCIADHLYTKAMPDPDMLIRTSGEMRISNFLLWQVAYSEIFITPTLWPDFTPEHFIELLKEYQRRDRRYGKVSV